MKDKALVTTSAVSFNSVRAFSIIFLSRGCGSN
ncbi:GSCOCG00006315001-RA-CDS [Cotesia congregata]|nr:GSCOCG00006315001-RA-CDS [Cotesia congregata]